MQLKIFLQKAIFDQTFDKLASNSRYETDTPHFAYFFSDYCMSFCYQLYCMQKRRLQKCDLSEPGGV
jgi:hypothetical protein